MLPCLSAELPPTHPSPPSFLHNSPPFHMHIIHLCVVFLSPPLEQSVSAACHPGVQLRPSTEWVLGKPLPFSGSEVLYSEQTSNPTDSAWVSSASQCLLTNPLGLPIFSPFLLLPQPARSHSQEGEARQGSRGTPLVPMTSTLARPRKARTWSCWIQAGGISHRGSLRGQREPQAPRALSVKTWAEMPNLQVGPRSLGSGGAQGLLG